MVDKTYGWFDEAIDQFAFVYDWYHITGMVTDDLGNQKNSYTKLRIEASIQPRSNRIQRGKEINVETREYELYCKARFQIDTGDFINYNNDWLIVNSVQPLNEYGVRQVSLTSANPAMYRDMLKAVELQTGESTL